MRLVNLADGGILNLESQRDCPHKTHCQGCQFLGQRLGQQKDFKIKKMTETLTQLGLSSPQVEFISPGDFALRDRLDFVYEDGRFGLYDSHQKKIQDLDTCGQLSPELLRFYLNFRKISWPIKKGSFRLRLGANGQRGVWLDFANQDIKNLLEEQTHLRSLMKMAFVEIGQKSKALVDRDGKLKLVDPEMKEWFETRFQEKNFPLLSYVSSFTQPSHKANLILGEILEQHYANKTFRKTLEFGAGVGNLSLIFLNQSKHFCAVDFDEQVGTALRENFKRTGQEEKTEVAIKDFQRVANYDFSDCDFLILNPPRSGLGDFLKPLSRSLNGPKDIFLMSCFLESWQKDVILLKEKGYSLERIALFDQFPQTKHFEILSFWKLPSQ